jgi:diguanylate cyclase (GGDEF)-like protein
MFNMALLLWLSRADHVTLHWPRHLQSMSQAMRQPGEVDAITTVRRRPLYVAERRVSAGGMPMSAGTAPSLASPHPEARSAEPDSAPRTPRSATLPPDLAELLSRPAAIAPREDTYGFGSNGVAGRHNGSGAAAGYDGENVLARLLEGPRGDGASPFALDKLTGLEGPASWSRIVEIENARLLRYRRPVTVVMAEVEGLRRLAERLGEEPVERLLPVIADAFRREARSSDWIARVGASRFAAFLPETDEIQAINYVERIRVVCEPWLASSAVPLRLAIGWSSPGGSTDLEYAISRAEERMHADRRMPGKSLQAPRVASARVVSLPAGSPATDGLADLTEGRVAPAETGRSGPRDGVSAGDPTDGTESGLGAAHGRGRRRPAKPATDD